MDVNASCTRLVTAASDNQVRVWALEPKEAEGDEEVERRRIGDAAPGDREGEEGGDDVVAVYMGSVVRQGNGERVAARCAVVCSFV